MFKRAKWYRQLKNHLAYIAYLKMYGIADEPFQRVEVHLSETNNEWNIFALSDSEITAQTASSPANWEEVVSVSETNNQWNKFATGVDTKEIALYHED